MQPLHIVIVNVERGRVVPVFVIRSSGRGGKLWVVLLPLIFLYFSCNTVDHSLFSASQVAATAASTLF